MFNRQEARITAEEKNRKREAKRIEEDRDREIIRQQERGILEEKLQAELKLTEKKLEMEKAARTTQAKFPKLKISPFNGTLADWVRFENMFVTQVDAKSVNDEEKFGYLLKSQAKLNRLHNCMGTPQKGICVMLLCAYRRFIHK